MDKDQNEALGTLAKLRQGALLLSLANKLFCEPPLLQKIGREMDRTLQTLPEQIESLKSRYPGKLEEELETGPLVSDLQYRVEPLRNPEAETRVKCGSGDLGRELELCIGKLTATVRAIAGRVEGRSPADHSKKASSMVVYRVTNLISALLRRVIPAIVVLVFMAALFVGYLYWSMGQEKLVEDRISALQAQVHSSREILGEIDREKDRISQRIEALKRSELHRAEKIEFMDLGQELHHVRERQLKVETNIEEYGKEMEDLRKKLKEMGSKSFFARLFRR